MKSRSLSLEGLIVFEPLVFHDSRGFFLEMYRAPLYAQHGVDVSFVQDSLSYSKKNTLRGLHFQKGKNQAKFVSCLQGVIWDVVVDIRPTSLTFGKWEAVQLDSEKREQLFIPAGFAHGFRVMSEEAFVLYKISTTYDPQTECTFRWNDPDVDIDWGLKDPILSPKDQIAPFFKEIFYENESMDHR